MNDQRFDEFARRIASLSDRHWSRRTVLRALGSAGAALATAGAENRRESLAADETATAAPVPGFRTPGGPTIAQKAFELEYDPSAIFRFVADHVIYDPYPGALRGAKGTLWGLAGNSVDQAALLAALLAESLVPTRFVMGSLSGEGTAKLWSAARIDLDAAKAHALAVNSVLTPDQGAPPAGVLGQAQRQIVASLPDRGQQIRAQGSKWLQESIDLIQGQLAAAGITLAGSAAEFPELERNQHVWVQFAVGPEWIDLDPSVPGAEPGATFATDPKIMNALPDALAHSVAFRVYAEKIQGGQPVQSDLLTYQASSADLVGRSISFLHAQPEALNALGAGIQSTLEGTLQYVPHLAFGPDLVVPGNDRVTLGGGGGLLDVMGDSGAIEGDTVAEWIEITSTVPGLPPRTATRTVFDRLSPEQRAGGNADYSSLPAATFTEFDGSRMFLPLEAMWSIVSANGPVPFSYFQQDRSVDDFDADLGQIGYAYHNSRDGLALDIASGAGHRFYLDAPNLTAFTITPLAISEGAGRAAVGIDLLHRSFGVAPFSGQDASADARVTAGVLSHVNERLLMERDPSALLQGPALHTVSVGRIFEEASKSNIPAITLLPGSAPDTRFQPVRWRTRRHPGGARQRKDRDRAEDAR